MDSDATPQYNADLEVTMSQPIIECVPNFSEGRDTAVIDAIADAIRAVDGVSLLDVDPGAATNRTVMTMVGAPTAVLEGAFQGIKKAQELIDMSTHSGAHPRMGATDVCPLVPVSGIDMDGCAALARTLAERVGGELGIPIYLYEHAASKPERQNLAEVRAGEYEGLAGRVGNPDWTPDFGPDTFNEKSGATAIGARPFLIAYNINLNTRNKKKAMKIAALVREKGIFRKENGVVVRDADGKGIRDPGVFKCVKGIGWFIEEYGRCQVSLNLTNYEVSPMHEVLEATRRIALEEGVIVTGSELVGLVPKAAMLWAGRYYLVKEGANPGVSETELIDIAISSLGLRDIGDFDPNSRIIESAIGGDGPLVAMTTREFVDTLGSSAPAPGGGSVASLCGAMSTALSAMVASLTHGKKGYEEQFQAHCDNAEVAQQLKELFLADIDNDTAAFNQIMAAMKLPKKTDEDKALKMSAMNAATRQAINVPLTVLERSVTAIACAEIAAVGNKNARSDAGVAGLTAWACAEGAYYNVYINLDGFNDEPYAAEVRQRADAALETVTSRAFALIEAVRGELTQ
jgi:glutamate formiminotransferase/formiminotetrahydrofolate cyclodeaminase